MGDTRDELAAAVRHGDLETVQRLVRARGFSYAKEWSNGYTLLREALRKKHTEVAEFLLASGVEVENIEQERGYAPLHYAVRNGETNIVKMLLTSVATVDVKWGNRLTPLSMAVDGGMEEITKLLLKKGAHVKTEPAAGSFPLHTAAQKGYIPIVRDLLKYGANVNSVGISSGQKGYTPLHLASTNGHEEIVRLLLINGAEVNAIAGDESTPLSIATEEEHEGIVKLLLENGASIRLPGESGKNILNILVEKLFSNVKRDIICDNCNKQRSRIERPNKNMVEMFLEHGHTVDLSDAKDGNELMRAAVAKGFMKIVRNLMEHGVNVNATYNFQRRHFTALHIAAKNNQTEMAEFLIRSGARVNDTDECGKTPLHYAVNRNAADIVELLLSNGARITESLEMFRNAVLKKSCGIVDSLVQRSPSIVVDSVDTEGRTALHWIAEHHPKNYRCVVCGSYKNMRFVDDSDDSIDLHGRSGRLAYIERVVAYDRKKKAAAEGKEHIAEVLLKAGADPNAKTHDGVTAIYTAVNRGDVNLVKTLLASGAEVNCRYRNDKTLLHIAVHRGSAEIVKALLVQSYIDNLDTESRDIHGRTALHIACGYGRKPCEERDRIVVMLLDSGSDVDARCHMGYTPYDIARLGLMITHDRPYGRVYLDSTRLAIIDIFGLHIIKTRVLEWYVTGKNLYSLGTSDGWDGYTHDCNEEIEKMINEKIGDSNISFFELMTRGAHRVATAARNESVVQALDSTDMKKRFPIYAGMIANRFERGRVRASLLDRSFESLKYLTRSKLSGFLIVEVLSYLSNKELKKLTDAC